MEIRHVVTCFLLHDGKILLVRRSGKVGTYRGRWSVISGYMEAPPREQALQEIREETGIVPPDVVLLNEGEPVEAADDQKQIMWVVHPFLFEVKDPTAVHLDWENTEARWVAPEEIADFETVPKLQEAWEAVRPESPDKTKD